MSKLMQEKPIERRHTQDEETQISKFVNSKKLNQTQQNLNIQNEPLTVEKDAHIEIPPYKLEEKKTSGLLQSVKELEQKT